MNQFSLALEAAWEIVQAKKEGKKSISIIIVFDDRETAKKEMRRYARFMETKGYSASYRGKMGDKGYPVKILISWEESK